MLINFLKWLVSFRGFLFIFLSVNYVVLFAQSDQQIIFDAPAKTQELN